MKQVRKRKLKIGRIIIALIVFIVLVFVLFMLFKGTKKLISKESVKYLASDSYNVTLYDYNNDNKELKENTKVVRGSEVKAKTDDKINKDGNNYIKITLDNESYYVLEENLVDKKEDAVKEKYIYVRTPASVLEDLDNPKIVDQGSKGEKMEVLSYDSIDKDGKVNTYKVKTNDNNEGYIYGKYIELTEEEAKKNYEAEKYDEIHSKIKNSYGGGDAIDLDFYPVEKASFDNNKMPEAVYSLYLNGGVIGSVDAYIEYAKTTKINAFVVDIVDDTAISYPSDVMKEISPTSYEKAINSVEEYKNAIQKIKDAGFYVIGRITVFKDSYYVADHPENAISSKATGEPFKHNSAYWPSAYSRDVWYYKVALAKEAVEWFGFNEINYDYVRFPDRMMSVEDSVNLHNNYDESKVQAIQRFVQYATDEIHKMNAYVSIDVFGESTNGSYTTAYGQYWPAISNVADVISGMPYPDHFSNGYYGISKPWNHPYELMNKWATEAMKRQEECPTPAVIRTWIQAYDVMTYVDSNGIDYNAENVQKEIEGLYDAGAMGGYITWNSGSNLSKYKQQKGAFDIDYYKEYSDGDNN